MIASIRNSLSGVKTGAKALGVSALNVANANNAGSLAGAAVAGVAAGRRNGEHGDSPRDRLYMPFRAENVPVADGGVQAIVRSIEPPGVEALADEALRSRQARTLYDANLKALEAEDEMPGRLLDDRA